MSENTPYPADELDRTTEELLESAQVDEPIPYLPALPDGIFASEETLQERLDRIESRIAFIQGQVEETNVGVKTLVALLGQASEVMEKFAGSGGGGLLGKLIGL